MLSGNAADKKARPNSAGLKMFWPKLPKISFPMPIENTQASTAIHTGRAGGITIASRSPVRSALPSSTRTFFPRAFCKIASVRTQADVQARIKIAAFHLKNMILAITAGINARNTARIIFAVFTLSKI